MLHDQDSVCKSIDMEELNISRLLEYRRNNSCRKTRQKTLTKPMLDSHILRKKLRLVVKEPKQRRLKKLELQSLDSFKRSESVIQEGLQTPVLSESKRRKQSDLSKPSSPPQLKVMSLTKKFEIKGSFFVSSNLSQFCNKKSKDLKSVDSPFIQTPKKLEYSPKRRNLNFDKGKSDQGFSHFLSYDSTICQPIKGEQMSVNNSTSSQANIQIKELSD